MILPKLLSPTLAAVAALTAQAHALELANINVVENDTGNTTSSVTVTIPAGQSSSEFFIRPGSNRGDYNIQIGSSPNDDFAGGILLAAIAQNGSNGGGFSVASVDWERSGANAGGYWIPVDKAGASGVEWNANVSAIYFPYANGWIGGLAHNATGANGGINNRLMTGGGLLADAAGNHAAHWGNFFSLGGGQSIINLSAFDSRADGIMFANHGKNEANFAIVDPTINGDGTWRIGIHDSNADGANFEQDPVAFAFVPLGTPGVTMGTITGNTGATLSQGNFTVQRTATGTHQLEIAGQSPTSGTLLLVPVGMSGLPGDNIVTYQPNGSGWEIQSRDLPSDPPSLQDNGNVNSYSFLFVPFDAIPQSPGAAPATPFNPNAVAAANFIVTEFNPGNTSNDMFARAADGGSRGLGTLATNRGDNTISFGGTAATSAQGIVFTSISENLRDNSATGGLVDYGVHGAYLSGGQWVVATERKSATNGEHNINFSAALVPWSSGFQMDTNVATPGGTTTLSIPGSGDTLNSGLLMVTPYGNNDNFSSVSPTADGSGWAVQLRDNSQGLEGGAVSYLYLPYGTENLVAGQISSSGYTQNRTGQFSLVRESTGVYRLSIPGSSPDTGMLLLNAGNTTTADQDNLLSYQRDGSDFLIHTLDAGPASQTIASSFQDTNFSFAYLDFQNPITNPQLRIFDPNAAVAGNFTVIQNNSGDSTTSISPTPSFTSDASFNITGGNRGDFDLSLDGTRLNVANGILITSIANNGRDNSAAGDPAGTFYALSSVESDGSGNYYVPIHRTDTGGELNSDFSAGFFPYAGGWKGAVTGGNGSSLRSGSLSLGPGQEISSVATGIYQVSPNGVDSSADGVLLASAVGNTNNFAQVWISGGGWQVSNHKSTILGLAGYQQQDISVVFLPSSDLFKPITIINPTWGLVAMGNVYGDGSMSQDGGLFSLSMVGTGQYQLDLGGAAALYPDLATLLLTPGGGGINNVDNFVTYERSGAGWLIETRDLGSLALHDVGTDLAFSFAILAATPEPSRALLLAIALSFLLTTRRRRPRRALA